MLQFPKWHHLWLASLVAGTILMSASGSQAATTSFTFTLPADSTTSAGAFDVNGNLLKTLWRRVRYSAGPHTEAWDGKKDNGAVVPMGTYSIRVLYHDVQYVWDGVVGTTSSSFEGDSAWFSNVPRGLAIDGTNGFVGTGYEEGQGGVRRFSTGAPQSSYGSIGSNPDTEWSFITTDGTRYYVADTGNGWDRTCTTLVQSFNVSDNSLGSFANGQTATKSSPWNSSFPNAIDVSFKPNSQAYDQAFVSQNAATGIAVQKSGNVLAVAHGPLNVVRLFDKTTGASLGNISVTAPKGIAFTNTGDLLVCTASSLKRYTSVGSANTLANTINTSQPAIAVAAHPTTGNDVIVVAVGGTSQQIKAYTSAGTALWTYGTAGGYNTAGPTVATNKFGFSDSASIAMQSDGSFWFYDAATLRFLHISSARAYIEQVSWLPSNYMTAVDTSNPTRVFGRGWLEYSVDYSKPLLPGDPQASGGNKSWKLVRNWGAGVPAKFASAGFSGLHTVVTLTDPTNSANKRTYGMAMNGSNGKMALLELPASGNLRETGIEFDHSYAPSQSYSLYGNGDLRYATYTNDANNNPIQTIYNQQLQSFDANGNPVWGTPQVLAVTPASSADPIGGRGWPGAGPWQFPVTDSNVVVSFDQSISSTGFHLGGAQVGTNSPAWKWLASPSYSDNIPLDGLGSFPVGGVEYGGNKVMAAGRDIVYGYHGEFWNQSQADQYMHFYDDGLFVGQFGVPGNVLKLRTGKVGGKGGNAFTPALVKYNGETYLWHGNESPIGGIQRWHLVGVNNIREIQATGTLGEPLTLTDSASPYPTGLTATPGNAEVSLVWQAAPGATGYKIKRATRSGGPYSTVTTATKASYKNTGLTNGTKYYYVVSAVVNAVEGNNSSQVSAVPFNTTQVVQLAGEAAYFQSPDSFFVDSTAPAKGQAATVFHSSMDQLGNLSFNTVGTKGYVLYDWSSSGSVTSNLAPGITVTPDVSWGHADCTQMSFIVDGVKQWRGNFEQDSLQAQGGSGSKIYINVNDSDWHFLTLFTPSNWRDARNQVTTLTPQGQTTPSVSYTAVDPPSSGFDRIYQFRFKGNVTLNVERLAGDTSGTVAGLFFDDVPANFQLGTGLTGQYYSDQNLTTLNTTRIDPVVDFDWGGGSPMSSVGPDNFSVRWSGQVRAIEAGLYTFTATADDGVRLWVNNQLIIDQWHDQAPTASSGTIALTAGQKCAIKMEYYESGGGAVAKLEWLRPGQSSPVVIPQEQLYPTTPTSPNIPTVSLTAPANNASFYAGSPANIAATASDTDGTISQVEFYLGNNRIGSKTSAPYSLSWIPTTPGSYALTAKATDSGGNTNTSATINITVLPTPTGSGSISREVWTGISGTAISSIPITTTPNISDTLSSFETPSYWADNYGTRIRGYITAPYTGPYTFWITGDDTAELWLSTNNSPANKVKIAYVNSWTGIHEWNKFPEQKSATINLTAGQQYYVEALQKEDGGGDLLGVAWLKPNQIGASPSEVIPGSALSPY